MNLGDFDLVRRLFEGHKQYIPTLSIIDSAFPGRIFVDDIKEPATTVVWALSRWAYIESASDLGYSGQPLADLIREVIIPDSIKMNIDWFELYARNDPGWIEKLDRWLRTFNAGRHLESVYIWDTSRYRDFRSRYILPDNIEIGLTEIPILPERLRDAPFVPDHFHSSCAVGCRARAMGRDVALCRSNGFAVGDEFMIDVITFDKLERGKGYATAASVGLLDYCLGKGLHPLWETTEDNTASRRLAQKLGFVEEETYPVYAIEF